MGRSAAPLLGLTQEQQLAQRRRNPGAAFSQYSRPYAGTAAGAVLNASWCQMRNGACTVGYSMVAVHAADGEEYRLTEWVGFNTPGHPMAADWSDSAGAELYSHRNHSTAETVRKTPLLEPVYYIKTINVPRQAWDRHRKQYEGIRIENEGRFLQVNLADEPEYAAVRQALSARLRAGPDYGGGWGRATTHHHVPVR
jgi:hypothetical protein